MEKSESHVPVTTNQFMTFGTTFDGHGLETTVGSPSCDDPKLGLLETSRAEATDPLLKTDGDLRKTNDPRYLMWDQ